LAFPIPRDDFHLLVWYITFLSKHFFGDTILSKNKECPKAKSKYGKVPFKRDTEYVKRYFGCPSVCSIPSIARRKYTELSVSVLFRIKPLKQLDISDRWPRQVFDLRGYCCNGQFHNCQSWSFITVHGQF